MPIAKCQLLIARYRAPNARIIYSETIGMIKFNRPFDPHAIQLVIFDLDGTLIDSRLDLVHSVNATLRHMKRPELPDDVIASYVGDGAPALIGRALGSGIRYWSPAKLTFSPVNTLRTIATVSRMRASG